MKDERVSSQNSGTERRKRRKKIRLPSTPEHHTSKLTPWCRALACFPSFPPPPQLTLNSCPLRRRGHADGPPATLGPIHGGERLVSLPLVAEPDETEALGRARHGIRYHFCSQDRLILGQESRLEIRIRNLRGEVSHENGVFRGLLYALAACAPVEAVAQRGAL